MRLTPLFIALALPLAPVHAQSARDAIAPPGHERATEQYHYSAAVRAGGLVFLSGVVAGLPAAQSGPEAESAAYDRAFATIARILEAAGTNWDHVVDITTYHTDLVAQLPAFAAVKDRYVRAPYPTWTAIDVDRLLPDTGLVEIKVIARMPDAAQ